MRSNPGLVQRMPYEINFPNYTREQLSEIFFAQARKDFLFGEEFIEKVKEYFRTLPNNIYLSPTFSNARFVRNLFERTWSKAVMRAKLEKAELTTLLPSDFEKAAEEMSSASNGAMVFGKHDSGATLFSEEDAKIRFADVCGEDEAKELLMEVVDFLKHPAKYQPPSAPGSPTAPCSTALRAPARPCWPRRWPGSPASPSCPSPAATLSAQVCGHRGREGAQPVPEGPGAGPLHRLYRRDRRHRHLPLRRRLQQLHPDPAAHRAGRLRRQVRDHRAGRHQPPRAAGTPPCAGPAALTGRCPWSCLT